MDLSRSDDAQVRAFLDGLDADGLSLAEVDTYHSDGVPGKNITARRWYLGAARRKRFLEVFAIHFDLDEACGAVGWVRSSYHRNRRNDRRFATEVDALRAGRLGRPLKVSWDRAMDMVDAARAEKYDALTDRGLPAPDDESEHWRGFAGFRRLFFGMESPWFHKEIVGILETSAPGSVTLILLPPESGKTSLLEDFCGYKLATDPKFRITYAGEKINHPRKALKRIKWRMDPQGPCPAYVARFGPFVPQSGDDAHMQPWNADYFDVYRRGTVDERDYSALAIGFGASVIGSRTDLLVLDDVQSLRSLGQTEKMVDEFRQDWLSRPGEFGRTVILGTRVGPGDFYERIIDEGLVDHLVRYPAIDTQGRHLWPERYTPEQYARMRKKAGESAWARNYQQSPMAAGDRTFSDEMLVSAGDPLIRWNVLPTHIEGLHAQITGHDPGFGKNAVVACAYTDTKLYVLGWKVDNGLTTTAQMAQSIALEADHWRGQGLRFAHLVIEDKYVGQGLFQDESFLDLTRTYGCSISGHKTGDSKYDDDLGIAAMSRSFAIGEVVLPAADDPDTQRARAALDAELASWRPHVSGTKLRQDLVMALWFVWRRWRTERFFAGDADRTNIIRTQGIPNPTPYRPVVRAIA